MKKRFASLLGILVFSLGFSALAGNIYPNPDLGTLVQDFRAAEYDGVYHDWDYFTPWVLQPGVTSEKGPNCNFFATYNDIRSTKTYWKDVTYYSLTGYQYNNMSRTWSVVPAKRVDRGNGVYQIRVEGGGIGSYPCCRTAISRVKITQQINPGYYYSFTRTLYSQEDGPNC